MHEIHRMLGAQREAEFEKEAQNWRRAKEARKLRDAATSTRSPARGWTLVGWTRRLTIIPVLMKRAADHRPSARGFRRADLERPEQGDEAADRKTQEHREDSSIPERGERNSDHQRVHAPTGLEVVAD